jgi:hypothetical protein
MPKPMAKTPTAVQATLRTSNNAYIAVLPLLDNRSAWRRQRRPRLVHAYPGKLRRILIRLSLNLINAVNEDFTARNRSPFYRNIL